MIRESCQQCSWGAKPGVAIACDDLENGPFNCPECGWPLVEYFTVGGQRVYKFPASAVSVLVDQANRWQAETK